MESLIRKALDHCGYTDDEATEALLIECFLDYVDGGVFGNLTLDEARDLISEGEITLKQICYNLLNTH